MFEIKDVDLAGRVGVLSSRRISIETPAFMPVIDLTRQEVPLKEIKEIGFNQVITNAYLILKRFGDKAIKYGIHGILEFDGLVMTDSGAYQILEYGSIDVDQRSIINYQIAIGTDIGVILDHPTGDVDFNEAKKSVELTLKRAREAESLIANTDQLWVLPIQGGRHFELVEYSAIESKLLKHYDMYGIGSPTVFLEKYMYDTVIEIIYRAKKNLPPGKPVHLFGAGHPLILPFAVALGVDTFDSASYILYARDDRYITEYGVYRLEDLHYLPCNCPICTRYSIDEIKSMRKRDRTRILALHNLYTIERMMRRIKQAIREGRLWELLEEVSRKHPQAYSAFRRIIRYHEYIEKFTPRVKGVVRGIRVYSEESLHNPKLARYRNRSISLNPPPPDLYGSTAKFYPISRNTECTSSDDEFRIYYGPYIGIIPAPLCGTYPSTQFDYPNNVPTAIIKDLVSILVKYVSTLRSTGFKNITIFYSSSIEWSIEVIDQLKKTIDVSVEMSVLEDH